MCNTTAGAQADLSQSIVFIIPKGTSDCMFMRTGSLSKPKSVSGYLVCVTPRNTELILKIELKTFLNIIEGGDGEIFFRS